MLPKADELRASFEITPEAAAGLLLAVLTVYQAYFHRLSPHITRLSEIIYPSQPGIDVAHNDAMQLKG